MKEIALNASKRLYGCSRAEIMRIREDLTLPNPKYLLAEKYSPYSQVSIPDKLFFFEDCHEYVEVPIGYNAEFGTLNRFKDVTLTDTRVDTVLSKLPPFSLKLRPIQNQAKTNFISLHKDNPLCQQGVICLKTGEGKTITSLAIAHELKAKTLVIVHKDDLVVGWKSDIKKCFGNIDIGLIKAGKRKIGDFITIATPQTLNRLPEDFKEELFNTFSLVIHDELHHCASTHFSISSRFNSRYKLGLTATPERNDGLTEVIHFYFGATCYESDSTKQSDVILPVEVRVRNIHGVRFNPNYDITYNKSGKPIKAEYKSPAEIETNKDMRHDYLPSHLRPKLHYSHFDKEICLDPHLGNQVLLDVMHHYKLGHSMVLFISQKEVCEIYYENLYELFGDEVQLFYGDSKESNEELLRRAEEKEVLITITTLAKGTEGTNVKSWEVEFLISSINNGVGVEQAIGRIRREKEGKINPVIVYDYRYPNVPLMYRHGTTRNTRYKKLGFKIKFLNTHKPRKRNVKK